MSCFILISCILMADDDLSSRRQPWLGVWELQEVVKNGARIEEPKGSKTYFTFRADGEYEAQAGKTIVGKGTFLPLSRQQPLAVDWTTQGRREFDGNFTESVPSLGIYKFDSKVLVIALKTGEKASERPFSFNSQPGSGVMVLRLRKFVK
jgi:uncharacterized protein (TIGR03067 family)